MLKYFPEALMETDAASANPQRVCHLLQGKRLAAAETAPELQREISAAMKAALSVGVKVRLVEPKTIPRSEGKAKRIVDLRKEK